MPNRLKPPADHETPAAHLDASALKHVLGYQLAQAAVVCNQVFRRSVGEPLQLRPVEYTVLQLIGANPGCSAVRLARALAVTKPNITMWVDRLLERGLIERQPSATDKRSHELRASAAGLRLVEQATAAVLAAESQALGHLSVGERSILAELLHKLSRSASR